MTSATPDADNAVLSKSGIIVIQHWMRNKECCEESGDGGGEGNANCTAISMGDHSSTVDKELCYKSEGRCFDSRWCHWNFSLT